MTLPLYIALTIFNLSLIVAMNTYVPKRLCSLFEIRNSNFFVLAFCLLTILGIAGIIYISKRDNIFILVLSRYFIIWLGLIVYLFCFLVIFEIINFFVSLNKKYAGIVIIGLSIVTVFYGIFNASVYKIHYVDIPIADLSKEVKIFHIPDLHLGFFRGKKTLYNIIKDINQLSPDLVIINGDLADGKKVLDASILSLFKQVKQPVYFTTGNHDIYVGLDRLKRAIAKNGIKIINNKVIHTHGIQLIGLNYMNADNKVVNIPASIEKETIKSTLQKLEINHNIPSIFIHHSPIGVNYMHKAGADLVLAGHTHGGQFFPATLIAKIIIPYVKALYKYKSTWIYVTQGVGTFGPPIRIGTNSEATLVRLMPIEKSPNR